MTDLCTLAQVKEFTNIVFTDLDKTTGDMDTFIGNLIDRVSDQIVSYTHRDFDLHTADISTYSVGPFNRQVLLVKGPIITLTTLEVTTNKGGTFETLSADDYTARNMGEVRPQSDIAVINKNSFGLREVGMQLRYPFGGYGSSRSTRGVRTRVPWYAGYENLRITSNYGYATIPTQIENIAIRMVDIILQERARTKTLAVRAYDDPENDSRAIPRQSLPDDIKDELDLWMSTLDSGIII